MKEIKSHIRINDILLGPLERPALRWLAAHQPRWVTPDILTGVGVIGAALSFAGYVLSNYDKNWLWLASIGFFINWYGDSLDGTLARFRKIERPIYGFFVDHTVDAVTEVMIIFGLGLSPYLRFDLAALLLTGYLLMSILVYVRTAVTGVFQLSYIGLGPTELRLIAVIVNTVVYFWGNPLIKLVVVSLSIFDLVVAVIAILLFAIYLVSMLIQARQLANVDEVHHN
jgi:archaetidylinositol phosphate synthase